MNVPADSAWNEHPDVFNDVVQRAKALGLTIEASEYSVYPDAKVSKGGTFLGWLHYNPDEDEWGLEKHERSYHPLDDVFEVLKAGKPI